MGTVQLTDHEKLTALVNDLRELMVYNSSVRFLAPSNHASNNGIETVDVADVLDLLDEYNL